MSEKDVQLSFAGQEIPRPDFNLAFAVGSLADDRVLAELLRVSPFDGNSQGVYRAILGYSTNVVGSGATGTSAPTVIPSGSANASVVVRPFRAVIGSRNAINAAPSPNPASDADALANWRDVRSGIWTGSATSLSSTLTFAANASGSPRWDLVYATMSVDIGQNTVSRRVKDPNSGNVTNNNVSQYLASPVTVQILQGTPAATPTPPALPADSAGNYNFPLAWVRIPNGFGASSTIVTSDIRNNNLGNTSSPTTHFDALASALRMRPASGNHDGAGTYSSNGTFAWNAAAGGRPGPFLPPEWVGGGVLFFELDVWNTSSALWSHPNGSVVDDSIDWRNRAFLSFYQCSIVNVANSNKPGFFNDSGSASTFVRLPGAAAGAFAQQNPSFGFGASTNTSSSFAGTAAFISGTDPAATLNLIVDNSTGKLLVSISGTPKVMVAGMLFYSAQFPNF